MFLLLIWPGFAQNSWVSPVSLPLTPHGLLNIDRQLRRIESQNREGAHPRGEDGRGQAARSAAVDRAGLRFRLWLAQQALRRVYPGFNESYYEYTPATPGHRAPRFDRP